MSEQQSWDAWRDPDLGYVKRHSHVGCTQHVRVVAWPEGAPPPEEVPHAGTRVELDEGCVVDRGTVVNGMPIDDGGGVWCMAVLYDGGGVSWPRLSSIRPLPEKRTASGEVVGRMVCTDDNALEVLSGFTLMPGKSYALIREDT